MKLDQIKDRVEKGLMKFQRLAGHSNITTTLRYYLRCPHKDDQIALERLTI